MENKQNKKTKHQIIFQKKKIQKNSKQVEEKQEKPHSKENMQKNLVKSNQKCLINPDNLKTNTISTTNNQLEEQDVINKILKDINKLGLEKEQYYF